MTKNKKKKASNLPSPTMVRRNCQRYVEVWERYRALEGDEVIRKLLAGNDDGSFKAQKKPIPFKGQLREYWTLLNRYSRLLLKSGEAWNMNEWVHNNRVWRQIKFPGFFEKEVPEIKKGAWGYYLECFLWWSKTKGMTVGSVGETDYDIYTEVLRDALHDVRALAAAATERIAGKPGSADVRPPLKHRERAILNLIPLCETGQGITGKELIDKLKRFRLSISQSTLTTHVIHKLKAHYGVEKTAVGYCRH
jgi:hypothetical protein